MCHSTKRCSFCKPDHGSRKDGRIGKLTTEHAEYTEGEGIRDWGRRIAPITTDNAQITSSNPLVFQGGGGSNHKGTEPQRGGGEPKGRKTADSFTRFRFPFSSF